MSRKKCVTYVPISANNPVMASIMDAPEPEPGTKSARWGRKRGWKRE